MAPLKHLLDKNRAWANGIKSVDPKFFDRLSNQQAPEYLWIGCADSRVPANQITGTLPGEVFVHRNIANVVVHTDMNCLSVLEYAVNVLKVEHVIVCGHYGCGGVAAALSGNRHGMIDNWLCHIKDVHRLHSAELDKIQDEEQKVRRLVELNVMEQVINVCKTSIIQESWADRNLPHIHGWVYELSNGYVKDLNVNIKGAQDLEQVFQFQQVMKAHA